MKFRVQSDNFSNERTLKYQLIKRKYRFAPHIHQYAELVIPRSGTLTITVDDKTEQLSVGDAALIFPCQVHSYNSNEYNELDIFVFSPTLLPELLKGIDGMVGDSAVFTPHRSSLDILRSKIIENENFSVLDFKGALYLLLSDYFKCVSLGKSMKRYKLSAEIVKYICDNLSEKITLADISNKLGYAKSYVSSEIRSFFGDNLATLVSVIRLEKATRALCHTEKPCSEIALEFGFGSERSFCRQFKSIIGNTPTEYRRDAVISKTGTPFLRKKF